MTSLLYGKRTPTFYGTDAEAVFEGLKLLNIGADAAAFPPVEIVPLVNYIPKWIAPVRVLVVIYHGTFFIDNVRQWTSHIEKTKSVRDQIHYKLLEEAEEMFAKGQQTESYIEYLLANQKALGVSRDEIA